MPAKKSQILHRTLEIDGARALEGDSRSCELSFSSDIAYERWWGEEILDHEAGSVRMDRLLNSAPLLLNHDTDHQIGVVESARIDSASSKGYATVRFGNSARANEILQDVKDGIRKLVSVGYRVHEAILEKTTEHLETYRITDWEPFEISIVPVPADISVGVGRSEAEKEPFDIKQFKKQETIMPDPIPAAAPKIDVAKVTETARGAEQGRVSSILDIAGRHNARDLADEFIRSGKPLEEFKNAVLEKTLEDQGATLADKPEIGLSDQEVKQFSFVRAINALANPTDKRAQEAAAFEFDCSRTAAEKQGKDSRGIFIPSDVLKRDLNTGVGSAGGDTVGNDVLGVSFIDLLRNSTQIMQRARILGGLSGNIAIPRQTGGATAYWVAEAGAPTQSEQTFDQVTLSPKTVGGFVDFSRKLSLQSSIDVESFVRNDLARVLGLEIDRVAINGSGVGEQPLGILNTTGIGSVIGGANGALPTFGHMVDLESEISADNADIGSLFYMVNAKTRGRLKQTEKASGTAQFVFDANTINGYEALTTNQIPGDLTKGTAVGIASAALFGNLSDLIIGMWGGLDLMVDPYSNSTSGTVRVVALQDVDIAVRHAESFAAMQDLLTA